MDKTFCKHKEAAAFRATASYSNECSSFLCLIRISEVLIPAKAENQNKNRLQEG